MSSMVLDGLFPRSRVSDPTTSVDAGRAADLKGSQAAVLERIRGAGYIGLTQPELEGLLAGEWSPSRVRSAVSELVQRGLVDAIAVTRRTRYGRRAQVYRAVPPG